MLSRPSSPLNQFFEIVNKTIFCEKASRKEKMAGGSGLVIGASSVALAYFLASSLGKLLAKEFNANAQGTKFLEVFMGCCAYVPTATLYGLPTYREFKNYAAQWVGKPFFSAKQDRKNLRRMTNVSAHFLGIFSGVCFLELISTYLGNVTFINYYYPVQVILISYLVTYRAEMDLANSIFHYFSEKNAAVELARAELSQKILRSKKALSTLSENDIQVLYETLTRDATLEENLLKLKMLFDLSTHDLEAQSTISFEMSYKQKVALEIFGGFGFLMGALCCYVLYEIAVAADETICDALTIDRGREELSILGSILGLIPNMIFNAILARQKCINIFKAFLEHNYCPTFLSLLAYVLATFSASANTYLAVIANDNFFNKLLIIPTFLGPFLARSLSFETLLGEGIRNFKFHFYKDSIDVKRKMLMLMCDKLLEAIEQLNDEEVVTLTTAMQTQPQTEEEKTESKVEESKIEMTRIPLPFFNRQQLPKSLLSEKNYVKNAVIPVCVR